MKTKTLTFALALSTLAFTLSAQAHNPKEHMKNAEKPDCSAMKNMDHGKMDMNDPVMQAMMKQCMKDMPHDGTGKNKPHHNHKNGRDGQNSEYLH